MGLGLGSEAQCISLLLPVDQDVKLLAIILARCWHVCRHAASMIMD